MQTVFTMRVLKSFLFYITFLLVSHCKLALGDLPAIPCFLDAIKLGLTDQQGILLCTNATNLEPIRCFKHYFEELTPDQQVALCQGAKSDAPNRCYEAASHGLLSFGRLSPDQRIKLCNTAPSLDPVRCYKKSAGLPLTEDQRVILCSNADSLEPFKCYLRSKDLDLSRDQRVRLCTQLTPSSWPD